MRILLDTHAFVWWVADDPRLTPRARRAISDRRNDTLFSVVSAWEIVTKARWGKLSIDDEPSRFLLREIESNAFEVLPLTLRHTLTLADLPHHHSDPFDRLLIAQAMTDKAAVVSADAAMRRYAVKIVW